MYYVCVDVFLHIIKNEIPAFLNKYSNITQVRCENNDIFIPCFLNIPKNEVSQ